MVIGIESSKLLAVSGFTKPFGISSQGQRAGSLVTINKGPEGGGGTPEQEQRREEAP